MLPFDPGRFPLPSPPSARNIDRNCFEGAFTISHCKIKLIAVLMLSSTAVGFSQTCDFTYVAQECGCEVLTCTFSPDTRLH